MLPLSTNWMTTSPSAASAATSVSIKHQAISFNMDDEVRIFEKDTMEESDGEVEDVTNKTTSNKGTW